MTEEEKDIRVKELEEFIEGVIGDPSMYGSYIWEQGWELLNKNKDEQSNKRNDLGTTSPMGY